MKWIKLWTTESLRGSIRFEFTPEERCVWYEILLLAGDSRTPGVIQAAPENPYPIEWIANALNISVELLEKTIKKCEKLEKITYKNHIISVLKWSKYQAKYVKENKNIPENQEVNNKVVEKEVYEEEEEEEEEGEKKKKKKKKEETDKEKKRREKREKKEASKEQYGESVKLTPAEYKKLIDEHGELSTEKMIIILDNYKLAHGATYKSDYHAILSWVIREYENRQNKINKAAEKEWEDD